MPDKRMRHLLVEDSQDKNDYIYPPKSEHLRKHLPARVDLRRYCPPVQYQGDVGACTAHALAAAMHHEQLVQKMPATLPSRRFIYYNERIIRGEKRLNHELNMRRALKVTAKIGACPESTFPYKNSKRAALKKPPEHAYKAAVKLKVGEYYRIALLSVARERFLRNLKNCLADGHPVVFGFKMFHSFYVPPTGKWKDGIMPTPGGPGDYWDGGHAVMAVGYDDRKQAVLVRNSWGKSWGIEGYFWMPYKLISDSGFTHDFWTIRGILKKKA